MIQIMGSRGTGKTKQLIDMALKMSGTLVCANPNCMRQKIKDYGYDEKKIFVVSYEEYLRGDTRGSDSKIFIDELDGLLKSIDINTEGYDLSLGD